MSETQLPLPEVKCQESKICLFCDNGFYRKEKRNDIQWNKQECCSIECANKKRTIKPAFQESKTCVICGNIFYRNNRCRGIHYDKRWNVRKYCSCECARKGKSIYFPLKGEKRYAINCNHCGKSFMTCRPKQVTCSHTCDIRKRFGHTSDPNTRIQKILSNIVITETGCFEYQGGLCSTGYGLVRYLGKGKLVHRLSYEYTNSVQIPIGLLVCHRCDNPKCINPAHLFLGTDQDNMTDAKLKGRLCRKITEGIKIEIFKMHQMKVSTTLIMQRFNLSRSSITRLVKNEGGRYGQLVASVCGQ